MAPSFLSKVVSCLAVVASIASSTHATPSLLPGIATTNGARDVAASHPGYRTVAYYVNWAIYARNFTPSEIPYQKLTHVIYAFANINNVTGEAFLSDTLADLTKLFPGDNGNATGTNVYGIVKQLYLLKKKNRNLKVSLSIGGFTYGANFALPMSTEQGRKTFAKTSVQLLKDLGFDGLDVDWEYPTNDTEANNQVKMLKAIREELDNYSETLPEKPHFLLTLATPAGPKNYDLMKIPEIDATLDFWSLMAYDFAGSWANTTGHASNIHFSQNNPISTPFSTDQAVNFYLNKGVAANKLLLGMPLYGRAFTNTAGPGLPYNGTGNGSWEAGVWDYKVLPLPKSEVYCDDTIIASWSYSNATRTMVSYDTPHIAGLKVDYIKSLGLGGAMWWEIDGDRPVTDDRSLIKVGSNGLGGDSLAGLEQVQNVLSYPQSKYDNLRAGMPGE